MNYQSAKLAKNLRVNRPSKLLESNIKKHENMKNTNNHYLGKIAAAALLGSIALSQSAQAIGFQFLPQTPAGDQYVFKIADFDNGTLYRQIPVGTSIGYSGNPSPAVGGPLDTLGVTVLDANSAVVPGLPAIGGLPIGPYGNKLEDSWGVAFVTEVSLASNPTSPVWSAVGDKQQLSIMFRGEQDFYLKQFNATTQQTNGVGLLAEFFLDDSTLGGYTPFDQNAGRGTATTFTTITDSNVTGGAPIITVKSTSGFIHPNGTEGGLAAEFETFFSGDPVSGSGLGTAFFDVVGAGTQNFKWNTNTIVSPYANTSGTTLLPGETAKRADMSIQFTTTTAGSGPNWLVSSQDPLRAFAIPEPGTTLTGLACMIPMLGSLLGRRRKTARV